MSEETWRPVTDWPYDVSSFGRVRNRRGHFLAMPMHKSGYLQVQLWNHGEFKTCLVHRLVTLAFRGPPPSDRHEAAHKDGNRCSNHEENLHWLLPVDNCRDRNVHGTTARGMRNGKAKHPDATVARARALRCQGEKYTVIAKALNLNAGTVYGWINQGKRQ